MSVPFVSAKSDKSVQNLLEVCPRLLVSPFYKLECAILCFIVTTHHDIQDKHINMKICAPLIRLSPRDRSLQSFTFERNEQFV